MSEINKLSLTLENINHREPCPPALGEVLETALQCMPASDLGDIARAVDAARDRLNWRVDRGKFYDKAADVGTGYLDGNMNCELIGPAMRALRP